MNTPALNGFLQNHQNGCDFYSKEPCSCGLEMARYELAQLKIALAVQTEAVEDARKVMLLYIKTSMIDNSVRAWFTKYRKEPK